ncbi:MAG: nitronate monooxygenase family protein [Bacteroidia bacterium]|nr:nitronate monooxygenase family protein [Bacteroidia bacterium]
MKSLKIGNLTIPIPIIQGGMGVGVSLSRLAAAVANEGGVGVISSAGIGLLYQDLSRDYLEASILGLAAEIAKARSLTNGVLGVNIMVALTNFADMVRTAIRGKIDIIFAGAGLPFDLPSYLTEGCKTKLVPIVSSGRAAKLICEKWKLNYNYLPDAFVVEGPKAGGHLGFKTAQLNDENFRLEILVKDVCREVKLYEEREGKKIPIIAAGGIYTGADIYNMLQQCPVGVQMGSRFVTTWECDAAPEFKQAYINASEKDIEIIESPVGMPGRAIVNSFINKIRLGQKQPVSCPFKCIKTCDVQDSPYCIISALINAYRGNLNNGFAFAGSNAYRATKIQSVKEIFTELKNEYLEEKKNNSPGI